MMNKIEEKISKDVDCRFLYPNGTFVWLIGGHTNDPRLESMMRYRIMHDLGSLSRIAAKDNLVPVCLITQSMAAPLVELMLPQFKRWGAVRFGAGELEVEDPNLVCARSADLIISYGEPSEELYELVEKDRDEERDGPAPEIIVRDILQPLRVKQSLQAENDPNAKFKGDVAKLRRWSRMPSKGLQVVQMIDMRPKFGGF